jgi:hypothetical protein
VRTGRRDLERPRRAGGSGASDIEVLRQLPTVIPHSPPPLRIDTPLDIVLLQDETGSMGDDIFTLSQLSPQMWDAIVQVATAGFRMSVTPVTGSTANSSA